MTTKHDQLKKELRESAETFQKKLEEDVNKSFDDLKKAGNVALMVGGATLAGYIITRIFSDEENETLHDHREQRPSLLDTLATAGTEMASVYLLTFAKRKLKSYIKHLDELKSEAVDEPSEGTGEQEEPGN